MVYLQAAEAIKVSPSLKITLDTRTKYFERMKACGDERSESLAFHFSTFSSGRSLDASEASFMGNLFI
jgi:hypothetical protein